MSAKTYYVITWLDAEKQFHVDYNESNRIAEEIADDLREDGCNNVQVTPIHVQTYPQQGRHP